MSSNYTCKTFVFIKKIMLHTLAKFKYQSSKVTKSVISSGKVFHDVHMSQLTINKTNTTGIEDIDVEKPVYNGRGESLSLDRNGLFLLKNANFDGINFFDHDEICTKYYKALEAFALKNIPNVHKVFFDCNICLECYLSHL